MRMNVPALIKTMLVNGTISAFAGLGKDSACLLGGLEDRWSQPICTSPISVKNRHRCTLDAPDDLREGVENDRAGARALHVSLEFGFKPINA